MKLKTNKDHQKGSFKKAIYKTLVVLGIETTILVSLFPGLVSLGEYMNIYNFSTSGSEKLYNSWYNPDHEIKDEKYFEITGENLAEKKNIAIDAIMNQDLSFLEEAYELKNLVVYNAQDLTDYEIEIIANSRCENVRLSFGTFEDVMRVSPCNIDLSPLSGKNISIFLDHNEDIELYDFYVLSMLTDYREDWFKTKVDFKKYDMINEKLDAVVTELEEDGFSSLRDRDKYILIADKVSQIIEYDPDVSEECRNNGSDIKDEKVKEKVLNYNKFLLSTTLLSNEEQAHGVCSNFAALTAAICNRLGLKCFYATGSSHAWVVAELENEFYVIDMTAMDKYFDDYRDTPDSDIEKLQPLEDAIERETFIEMDTYYENHEAYTNVDYMIEDPVIDPKLKGADSVALLVKKRILPSSITREQIISTESFAIADGAITALLIVVPKGLGKKKRKKTYTTNDPEEYFDPNYRK